MRPRMPFSGFRPGLVGLAILLAACATPAANPATSASKPAAQPATAPASAPASAAASAAPAAPAAPPPTVKLTQVEPGLTVGLAVMRAGTERGLFATEGLEMEFSQVPRGDTRMAAAISGDAQILLGSAEDIIRAREQDIELPIVAGLLNAITYNIVGQPQYHALADLRGGTIGVVDLTSGSTIILFEIMRANSMELNRDYQALTVGGASDRVTALRTGVIAATTLPVPDSTRVIEEGYTNLGDAADYIKAFQNSPVAVRKDWAVQNRDVLVRYLRAYLRTLDWLYSQKDEFVAIAARLLNLEPRYAAFGYDVYAGKSIWPRDGRPTVDGMNKVISILTEQGTFGNNPPPPAEKYLDTSYVDEARRTLGGSAQ